MVSWCNPAQPRYGDNVNANPEQKRMGNKIRVSTGLSQTKPRGMLILTSAVTCIYVTLNSRVPQAATAARMSVCLHQPLQIPQLQGKETSGTPWCGSQVYLKSTVHVWGVSQQAACR